MLKNTNIVLYSENTNNTLNEKFIYFYNDEYH